MAMPQDGKGYPKKNREVELNCVFGQSIKAVCKFNFTKIESGCLRLKVLWNSQKD